MHFMSNISNMMSNELFIEPLGAFAEAV